MFKVEWDVETNGILLSNEIANPINPPRPVFYEELDLLGFNKYWEYPKVEEPLLWSIGRKYYYKGVQVAEAKGGNIFEAPKIIVTDAGKNLQLMPINIMAMVDKNKSALNILENEAIDFIYDTYTKYKDKVDHIVVSYSGGKDSQVILDLVSRTLPPDEYKVIFTDTTMEIPPTYEAYRQTKKYYQSLYPGLKFYVARNEHHSYDLWKVFGPPSRIIRWCCSVYKTSPQVRLLRTLTPNKQNFKILVFDGVRADESARRSGYKRIAEDVKHFTVINTRIILNWNDGEVYSYLFSKINNIGFNINHGYRFGLSRVGCSICPFASDWSEFIINKKYKNLSYKYLNIISDYAYNVGIHEPEKIKEFIYKGNWKKRFGGKGINSNTNIVIEDDNNTKGIIYYKNKNLFNYQWLKIFESTELKKYNGKVIGKLKINNSLYKYEVHNNKSSENIILSFSINHLEKSNLSLFKKLINKLTFCISCGLCIAECPNNAIDTSNNKIFINTKYCKRCYKCFNFNEQGCHLAKSLNLSKGDIVFMSKTKSLGIDKYSTFGFREAWLNSFFNKLENWFIDNNLGPKQVMAFINWLKEAEILDKNKKITTLGLKLSRLYDKDKDFVWQIILVNLFYNSRIFNWYLKTIKWDSTISKNELFSILKEEYPQLSDGTLLNPLYALINTFEYNTYLSKLDLCLIEKIKNEKYINKRGTNNINPLSIMYCLFRYSINNNLDSSNKCNLS